MKQSLPNGVIIGVIALLVIGIGLLAWKKTSEPSVERDTEGNLVTGIDPSKVEKDPVKFKKAMDDLVQQEKAAKDKR